MNKIYLSALALIASASISAQILNPGFENWTAGEPTDWITLNGAVAVGDVTDGNSNILVPAVEETAGATEGSSYLRLNSFNLANSTDVTNFPNQDYGSIAVQDFNGTDQYVDFSFDVKYDVVANDTAIIMVQSYDAAGNVSGQGFEVFGGSQATFNTVTIPMMYIGAVASHRAYIVSSESQIFTGVTSTMAPGSWIAVDNIVVGAPIPDVPNVSNVVATDISDNHDGSDLTVTFDVPDETNVNSYYALAMASDVTPAALADGIGFILANGTPIAKTGAAQSFNFTAAGEYWRINAAGNAVEAIAIEEDVEMNVYILVEGSTGYNSVYAASNAVTLTSPLSVAEQVKEINVYPNPANNFVNFKVDGLENGSVIINSITGQEVVNTAIGNGTTKVNVSNLNNGVYIYTVRNQNGEVVKTNKLVVRK